MRGSTDRASLAGGTAWCSTRMDWLKYLEVRYVLFALWITGALALVSPILLPKAMLPLLQLGNGTVLTVPIGLVTIFSFVLWLRLLFVRRSKLHVPDSLKNPLKGSDWD